MRMAGLGFTALLLSTPAIAQPSDLPVEACAEAVGTFLLADMPGEGIPDRTLFLLTNGGHAIFVNSGQWGSEDYAPFSDALGSWICLSEAGEPPAFRAVVIDFTAPAEGGQQVARVDIDGTLDADGTMTLSMRLSFFPLEGDPLAGPADDAEPFTIVGERVTVPE